MLARSARYAPAARSIYLHRNTTRTVLNHTTPRSLLRRRFSGKVVADFPRRGKIARTLNPWVDLAHLASESDLQTRVASYVGNFGLVSTLICALAAGALTATPKEAHGTAHSDAKNGRNVLPLGTPQEEPTTRNLSDYSDLTVCGNSVLLRALSVSPRSLHDTYIGLCAGSFYTGLCGLGLSTVLLAWSSMAAPGTMARFVVQNSLYLCAVPFLAATSVALVGAGICVGIDVTNGAPASLVAFLGFFSAGSLVLLSTARSAKLTYRNLVSVVKVAEKQTAPSIRAAKTTQKR
jgi:hypothetical protein